MDRNNYNFAINKNTFECWAWLIFTFFISYTIEVFRGLRTVPYYILFCFILFVPYIIAIIYNKKNEGINLNLKYIFVVSYMLLYTFVMLTTKTYVTYVYVIPMVFILTAYCDSELTFKTFVFIAILNLVCIIIQYNDFMSSGGLLTFDLNDRITMWEIQMFFIVLSGFFLSKTCTLIKMRDDILDILSDDLCKDVLTGIYNKKFIDTKIKKIYNNDKSNSIAFIDIDDFKKFNTLYGHNFGDEVLITLCEIINSFVDKYEDTYFIRVGGDEFIIFSQDFSKDEFIKLCKNIVDEISKTKIPFGKKKVGIKISIGLSNSKDDRCYKYIDLYNLADKRNGYAKKNGKNYVESNLK